MLTSGSQNARYYQSLDLYHARMMAARHRSVAPLIANSRPDSRASTTSAASQHHGDHGGFMSTDAQGPSQMIEGPEAALLQYHASMVPQGNHSYPLQHMPQHGQTPVLSQQSQSNLSPFASQSSFFGHDSQFIPQEHVQYATARLGSAPVQSSGEMTDDKRRKSAAVTATNDKELREMLARNEGRPLQDVAQEVIQKERTPMAEKTKQLFAMLWLRAVCKPAKTSVPRNRVYSQYANRCGTERVVPLNPASFGKLVRVIFPGIQTRRLGVRGESKYHYVDLALEDESAASASSLAWHRNSSQSEAQLRRSTSIGTQQIDFNNIPRLHADSTVYTAAEAGHQNVVRATVIRGPASQSRAFAYPDTRGMQPGPESATYGHMLRFPSTALPSFSETEAVQLPAIQPYLPVRTDSDSAEALVALYRTHCTSLIDSIRFCKEKQFFRLYASFHGTLTVPVQKLFTHLSLAPWIEQCDLVMYRTMVRFVSRLTLQAAPAVVINILSNISTNLHGHIAKTFASQPVHVLEAKLRPATIFASLLYRLIRVNQAAHAAANLLTIDQNREQMWREWTTMVNPKRIMEAELPECGFEETYKILTSEMRNLLEPLQAPSFHDDPYGLQAYSFEADNLLLQQNVNGQLGARGVQSQISTENVLDRWSSFISSMPGRFPQTPARTLLHCISAVGTAALRDITILNGLSYGHWWVLKIFVDEMALWMAEMGGFLEPSQEDHAPPGTQSTQSPTMPLHLERSHSGSRMSSAGMDMNSSANNPVDNANRNNELSERQQAQHYIQAPQTHQMQQQAYIDISASGVDSFALQPATQNFGNVIRSNGRAEHGSQDHKKIQRHDNDIDDSGIGMSLTEDDLSFMKMGINTNNQIVMNPTNTPQLRIGAL